MEIFSEVYSCYYQVLRKILNTEADINVDDIKKIVSEEAFAESLLSIVPKITNQDWDVFEVDNNYVSSKLYNNIIVPLSSIQRSYLKALLQDKRIRLFLYDDQISALEELLKNDEPLWDSSMFNYYDQFSDGDPYDNIDYQNNFKAILKACKKKQYLDIEYISTKGRRCHHYFCPGRIEYSIKNDKFRIIAIELNNNNRRKQSALHKTKLTTLNMENIICIKNSNYFLDEDFDINNVIQKSYYKEPVTLLIKNERNALERTMLHFANYEKNTTKIDENTYKCLIYYNQSMETELLIEILSFGPMIKVIGNNRMLELIKARLNNQAQLISFNNNK